MIVNNLQEFLDASPQIKLMVVSSENCGACKILKNMIKDEVDFFEIDGPGNPELIEKFNIKSVPTMIFWNGEEVKEVIVGIRPMQFIKDKLQEIKREG